MKTERPFWRINDHFFERFCYLWVVLTDCVPAAQRAEPCSGHCALITLPPRQETDFVFPPTHRRSGQLFKQPNCLRIAADSSAPLHPVNERGRRAECVQPDLYRREYLIISSSSGTTAEHHGNIPADKLCISIKLMFY